MPNFPKNEHFLPPDSVRIREKKCSFLGKFGMLCFLVTPVLRFALSPYYRRIVNASRAVVFLFVFPVEQICFFDFVIKSSLKAT